MAESSAERWSDLERIIDQALDLAPDLRSSFLTERCSGDQNLRAEAEQLLRAAEAADFFLDQPAPAYAAPLVARVTEGQPLVAGTTVGAYEVVRRLGRGGTATVYLARDTKHHRSVAIKVLHPWLATSLGSERFLREIELAATLQHPHILPLFDSGDAEGLLYYVMPHVEGESLRQRLGQEKRLRITDAVRIVREVAGALDYAHRRGFVHRDIKPENILLQDGQAVVADFGIARAIDAAGADRLTEKGFATGTPRYMSPEQGAGAARVDGRTDIYALGCVLYELLAGHPPFTGPTAQAVITRHADDPVPPLPPRAAVPAPLKEIIDRALAKSPGDRFATARDFAEALSAASLMGQGKLPDAASATPSFSRWRTVGLLGLAMVAALTVGGLARTRERMVVLGRESRITDVPGLETDPVISPDGAQVAYSAGPFFQSHIYVRPLSGGAARDVTPTLPGRHTRPRWSPNGSELLFVTSDGPARRVSRVAPQGGASQPMVQVETDELITSADWSADGSRIVYDLGDKIFVTMPDHDPRRIYRGTDPHSVTWSPDGRFVAFVEGESRLFHGATGFVNTAPSKIVVIPEGGGVADTITPTGETDLSPTWAPESRNLFFVSDRDGAKDIYRVRLTSSGGVASSRERLTTGLNAQTLALSRDGRTLAFSTLLHSANAWMLRLRRGWTQFDDDAVQVTNGEQVIERLNISPDEKWLYFDSNRRGNADVYRLALDRPEAEPERLTTDSAGDFAPTVSPDGREIVFHSLRRGNRDLWLMSSDGTNQRPLTNTPRDEYGAVWSRDGSSIGFSADSAGMIWLSVVARDSTGRWGVPRLVLGGTPGQPAWSPDGKRLAVLREGAIMVFSLPNRKLILLHRLPTMSGISHVVLWSSDGRSLYYRQREPHGRTTLLSIPVSGGPPVALVRQRDASRSSARSTWFTDGRLYFFTIDRYEGDIFTLDVRDAAR